LAAFRKPKNVVVATLEAERELIGKLLQYRLTTPHIVLSEEQVSSSKKFNKHMLWIESMKDFLMNSISFLSKEYSSIQWNQIVLLLDIEERKGLGGKRYRLYKILYENKNLYFILSETAGDLVGYFELLSFPNI